jgi:antitoxin YefM
MYIKEVEMETISYTAARANFKNTMKKVCDDHAPIMITCQNEEPVVMMSLEEYQSLTETVYLLRSPNNALRLTKAIKDIEEGKNYSPKDLFPSE